MSPEQWLGGLLVVAGLGFFGIVVARSKKDGANGYTVAGVIFVLVLGASLFLGGEKFAALLDKLADKIPNAEASE